MRLVNGMGLPNDTSLVEAAVTDLPAVIDDLAAAFAEDELFDWFLRDDQKRDIGRKTYFDAIVRHVAFGTARIERPAGGGAVAIWMPQGANAAASVSRDLQMLSAKLRATGHGRAQRLFALESTLNAQRPTHVAHADLWFLGVRPERRGQGLGSALLKAGLDRLDRQNQAVHLQIANAAHLEFFQRHGFSVTNQVTVRPASPPIWGMWRDVRKALF